MRKGSGRGANAGCIKLKQHGITVVVGAMALPYQVVYVSRLLGYMYRGPPPSPELEACHLCELRMCMAPWHLAWHTHQSNTLGHFVHKKNRKRYPPPHSLQPRHGCPSFSCALHLPMCNELIGQPACLACGGHPHIFR